nr:vegetative cell wall protein gp1-like [Penaeus vannamei]
MLLLQRLVCGTGELHSRARSTGQGKISHPTAHTPIFHFIPAHLSHAESGKVHSIHKHTLNQSASNFGPPHSRPTIITPSSTAHGHTRPCHFIFHHPHGPRPSHATIQATGPARPTQPMPLHPGPTPGTAHYITIPLSISRPTPGRPQHTHSTHPAHARHALHTQATHFSSPFKPRSGAAHTHATHPATPGTGAHTPMALISRTHGPHGPHDQLGHSIQPTPGTPIHTHATHPSPHPHGPPKPQAISRAAPTAATLNPRPPCNEETPPPHRPRPLETAPPLGDPDTRRGATC